MRNKILRVAGDVTWQDALERSRQELGMMPTSGPKLTRAARHRQALERAAYGPPGPVVDPAWLFTPHPYPEFQRVTLLPEHCARLLDVMVSNRHPRPKKVATIARSMLQDHFYFTNQGPAVNSEGQFQDGLNRALASVLADRPIDVAMFVGMPVRNFTILDQGTPRNMKDTFDALHRPYSAVRGGVVRMLMQHEQWREQTHLKWRNFLITMDELVESEERYGPDLITAACRKAYNVNTVLPVSVPGLAAAFMMIGEVAPQETVDSFVKALARGNRPDTAIETFRNGLLRRQKRGERRYDQFIQLALIILTWNLVLSGENPSAVVFPTSSRQDFPSAEKWRLEDHTQWMSSLE